MTCTQCGSEVVRTDEAGLCPFCAAEAAGRASSTWYMKDNGTREEQAPGGALREAQAGKGRFDLLPCEVWVAIDAPSEVRTLFAIGYRIRMAFERGDRFALCDIIRDLLPAYSDMEELARWYEAGAAKYGDRNWEKGLVRWQVESSALRHAAKWAYGMTDEPHKIALAWNLAAWLYFNERGWVG